MLIFTDKRSVHGTSFISPADVSFVIKGLSDGISAAAKEFMPQAVLCFYLPCSARDTKKLLQRAGPPGEEDVCVRILSVQRSLI